MTGELPVPRGLRAAEPTDAPAGLVRPDLVTGPRPWPDPDDEGDDAPCCDGEGCAWCDQDYWRGLYRELHQAYEALMHEVRQAALELEACWGAPQAVAVGKHLRAKVGEAAVRRAAVRRYE